MQMLPTARIYARTPFFNLMDTVDGFGELILRPHPKADGPAATSTQLTLAQQERPLVHRAVARSNRTRSA